MTHEETIEAAKKLLEEAGFSIIQNSRPELDALYVHGGAYFIHFNPDDSIHEPKLLGSMFEIKIIDDMMPREYVGQLAPPKNKPWYQLFDKYVGKHRK